MGVTAYDVAISRPDPAMLERWREVPAAVASDCLGRSQAMTGAISPLRPSMRVLGPARTVACMAADNSALHAAIGRCAPGDVIVCDGKGFEGSALFGGLLTRAAQEAGVAGLVIDGAVRDSEEIVEAGFACFSRAVAPAGPHKGFGGVIDGVIACGGVAVAPGDLIVGDGDGVTVVPRARIAATRDAAAAILAKEARALESVAAGGSLAEVYGVPEVTLIPPEA